MKVNSIHYLVAVVAMFFSPATATIYRVDNNGGTPGDFTTLQAAHDGAAGGDTLYVYGSPVNYGTLSLSKKLTIIGPGFFLSQNPQTQANPAPAMANYIHFNIGSEGSLVTGLMAYQVNINTDEITLRRMHIAYTSNAGAIVLAGNTDVVTIQQCYILNSYGASSSYGIVMNGPNTSVIISNNYIDISYSGGNAIYATGASVAAISHNIISGDFIISNSPVSNNIFRDGSFSGSSANIYLNNMCNSTQLGATDGNLPSVDMATVFVGTGSSDGQWQLADLSPAIGAGTEGADMGMFGGGQPYVLSGVPTLPHIYYLTVPSAAEPGDPLQVRVKAKTGE